MTLSSFIPDDQDEKLAALQDAMHALGDVVNPARQLADPTDQEQVAVIRSAADALDKAARGATGPGAEAAHRVLRLLQQLATADPGVRKRAQTAVARSLKYDLERLRRSLSPERVTLKSLPPHLVRNWVTPDGRARVEVIPAGDPNDIDVLQAFATTVLSAAPQATGAAVSYYESGKTVASAFVEAGVLALAAITILLIGTLRRVTDVLLTLIPLLVAGAVTLELSVLWGLPLNFANIIALPLLLGVGVAFKIYYVMAWRAGKSSLLQSTLTRAVVFSGLTNAAAFGSMWVSKYPGMSSMGKMMALSLFCTMAAAVLFQPVLMGRPRQAESADSEPPQIYRAAE